MLLFAHRICLILAVVAVANAQFFGVQRGYVCLHGNDGVVTMAEHCHETFHDGNQPKSHCESRTSEGCDDHGEKHHHHPLKVDMQIAPSSLNPVAVPAFVAVLASVDCHRAEALFKLLATRETLRVLHGTGADGPPSLAVQVVACQVIRV
jgi:hypothetical protein